VHTLHSVLVGIAVLCCAPYSASAQQAEVPVYKDGDWWRVKMEFASPPGVSAAYQLQSFPKYLVKFETGKAKLMGVPYLRSARSFRGKSSNDDRPIC